LQNFSFQLPTYQGSVLEAFRRTKHGTVAKLIEFCNWLYKNIPLREALDMFYKSRVYQEMRIGISDMHCRSDKWLAEELAEEYCRNGALE
jgi:hypothetical protein